MKLTVTARHLTISDVERGRIAAKVAHLDRVLNDHAVSAACVVTQERQQVVCELTVHVKGNHMLVGVGKNRRIVTAASMAVGKVSQQAKKLATRWKAKRHKHVGPPPDAESPREAAAAPRIIRARSYEVKPMSIDDAVLLLAAGPQSFLVFRDAVSEAMVVIYKRPDGNYGLIEPEA